MIATMTQNNKAPITAQAFIIAGGTHEERKERAQQLGQTIVSQSGHTVRSASFMYLNTEGKITREIVADILHELSMASFGGEPRIIILEEAENMTVEAGNALLKTLEEPPEQVFFMLLTPTVARMMPTLRSRSQIVTVQTAKVTLQDEKLDFFNQTIPQRFAYIASLTNRDQQLDFAKQILHGSQQQHNFAFAEWLQTRLMSAQKSGNLRLLLEASALRMGDMSHV